MTVDGSDDMVNFNPRSREGSDPVSTELLIISEYFNPRSREGSDDDVIYEYAEGDISIHAPARGATPNCGTTCVSGRFQSTLPRGERPASFAFCSSTRFQSTLPRGERPDAADAVTWSISHFNPRSREGSDFRGFVLRRGNPGFQSTLPRGERLNYAMTNANGNFISIHAPARGATQSSLTLNSRHIISIHAPARGATTYAVQNRPETMISIHAPARGATLRKHGYWASSRDFNPRSREGSDK